MWDIVWVLPQGHRSVSVSRHFVLQSVQCPCSMQNGSIETTVAKEVQKTSLNEYDDDDDDDSRQVVHTCACITKQYNLVLVKGGDVLQLESNSIALPSL